jgi:hypothetical protein
VVDAGRRPGLDQRDDLMSHINRPGRLAVLVIHHVQLGPLPLKPDHRPDEIRAVGAIEPGGPHHVPAIGKLAQHGLFPGQLGAPVSTPRRRDAVLRIRPLRCPVEHVVSGQLDEARATGRARGGEGGRAAAVDRERRILVRLGGVDRRPGSAIDDNVRPQLPGRGTDGGDVRYVEFTAVQAGGLGAVTPQPGQQVVSEHPLRASDQPPAHGASAGPAGAAFSGSHQLRFSSYQRTVAFSASANGLAGAYPIPRSNESSSE